MKQLGERPLTTSPQQNQSEPGIVRSSAQLSLWQLNLLRVGYLVMGGGLAVVKWPLLFDHGPWELKAGTVEALLVGMSLLALLGLRYPLRMLPILLFEVTWKLIWLGVVALPLWLDNELDGANLEQANTVLLVVIFIAVIPWRHVVTQYLMAPGEPWRRSRQARRESAS
ncbi:MAG: hypothetical protein QOF35_1987 [Actinomycetota bacterium]|jgi:hypothetical protein|nr:hypothetical protein [Actinomycetota bacterium]